MGLHRMNYRARMIEGSLDVRRAAAVGDSLQSDCAPLHGSDQGERFGDRGPTQSAALYETAGYVRASKSALGPVCASARKRVTVASKRRVGTEC